MPGRHATDGESPHTGRTLLVIFLVVSVPILSFVGVRQLTLANDNKPTVECTGSYPVKVAAAPEIAEPLEAIAARLAQDKTANVDGKCLALDIERVRPVDMFKTLSAESGQTDADLWVPDSLEWVRRAGIQPSRILALSPSVAASPLVLAAKQETADKLGPAAGNWESLAQAGGIAVADPEDSAAGLATLIAIKRTITGGAALSPEQEEQTRRRVGANVYGLLGNKVNDLSDELEYATRDGGLRRPVPLTEQQFLSFTAQHKQVDLTEIMPKAGTVLLDYPLIGVLHKKPNQDKLIQAGNELMRHVDTAASRQVLHKAGFRDFRGLAAPPGTQDAGTLKQLSYSSLTDADDVMRSWAAMSIGTRMLAVIDLSGSMKFPADEGRNRIQLARDAAQTALGYFPDSAQIGLWGFSVKRQGNRDYVEYVPVETSTPKQRKKLVTGLDRMVGDAHGGTGLYDTVLAAYRTAINDYDDRRINSIVLLTDGKNEDDPGSIDKQRLLNELQRATDPATPVSMILIGIGPTADVRTLGQIANAAGGVAYQARSPKDMERIVIDALLRRQCSGTVCR
ncbi:substrate-binding domain-containing protein [Flindersiella endophytica]